MDLEPTPSLNEKGGLLQNPRGRADYSKFSDIYSTRKDEGVLNFHRSSHFYFKRTCWRIDIVIQKRTRRSSALEHSMKEVQDDARESNSSGYIMIFFFEYNYFF
ncbi:hypothetical protein HNY73_008648 [Argiope bruennichi]|uniref:Uncharacterized protein n=1 Tax=Argiope bruennichi TaxID=94029 RepID=A0A8T0FCE9_ARGBR|nr:hypothetical protein HNY73_008648 [Argiope bruennichi]KAF8787010.1 hypothetical protein HNY73_008648 [Argiope bruennichi]